MNTLVETLPKSLRPGSPLAIKLNRILPVLVAVILIIACSYTLSQITWLLIPEDASSDIPPSIARGPGKQPFAVQHNYRHISEAHLFGVFQQSETPAITTSAPDTRLNLVLKGVLAATPMKNANAIISIGKNGAEDNYAIGDKVTSATIREIYEDRVILERSGRLETLRMPKDFDSDLIQSSPRPSSGASSRTGGAGSPGAVLADIRKQILRNPTSFGQYAIPVPYNENGRLRGYRLQPQGDRALFDSVGLKESDVIVAINGVELNNPAKGIKALRTLQSAKQVDITVLRNGAEMPLHFEIP